MKNSPHELAKAVLAEALTMVVATVDEGGPWAAEVVFVNPERFEVWWMSRATKRHSLAIGKDGRVAMTVTAERGTNRERALQMSGRAERVEGAHLALGRMMAAKRGKDLPVRESDVLEDGYVWWRAVASEVYLIHSEAFGRARQRVV